MSFINEYLELFLLFFRVGGFIVSAPLFKTKFLPSKVKVFLCIVLTYIVSQSVSSENTHNFSDIELIFQCVANIGIGIFIGTLLQVAFNFMSFGGHLVAMGSGLGFSTLADPVNGNQTTTLSSFYQIVGSLLFVCLGGLYTLLIILIDSIEVFPLIVSSIASIEEEFLLRVFVFCMQNALLLAIPMMFTVLLINLAFGVISKASPSLNVFSIGFPVGILATFLIMTMTVDTLPFLIKKLISQVSYMVLGV